jgi:hypothetical protein
MLVMLLFLGLLHQQVAAAVELGLVPMAQVVVLVVVEALIAVEQLEQAAQVLRDKVTLVVQVR